MPSSPSQPGNPPGEPPWGRQPPGYGSQPNPHTPPPPPGSSSPQAYPGYSGFPGNFGYPRYVDPQAPYGRDQTTGLPLSDRSATTAGLLQLFLGVFGIGRFYIDSTHIAVAQLCLGLFGVFFTLFCLVGFPVLLGGIVWAIVDAIFIFTGNVKDNHGRKLR